MGIGERQVLRNNGSLNHFQKKSVISTFSDQRSVTSVQLKQQELMQHALRPNRAQLQLRSTQGNVLQAVTKVVDQLDDQTSSTTRSKEIETRNQGTKWFKFGINGNVINSFSNNIYSGSGNKGSNPVSTRVEIGAQASEEGLTKTDIPDWTRAKHFGLGDRATSISASHRKGKWTWHHQNDPYYMELVDMYVHGGFGHHGGYANWDNDIDSDDNVD